MYTQLNPIPMPMQYQYNQTNTQRVPIDVMQAYNQPIQLPQQLDRLEKDFAEGAKLSNGANILLEQTKDDCMYQISSTNQQGMINIKRVHVDYIQDKNNPTTTTIYETNVPERAVSDFLQGMKTITRINANQFQLDTVTGKQMLTKEECQKYIDDNRLYLPKA